MRNFDAKKLLKDIISEDRKVHLRAADDISSFDAKSSVDESVFVDALHSENEDIVFWSIIAIEHLGPRGSEAIPKLILLTQDERLFIRQAAVKALARVGPCDPSAKKGIFQVFHDREACARREALQACIDLPDLNENELEAIAAMATDPDEAVSRWSEIVLRNIKNK